MRKTFTKGHIKKGFTLIELLVVIAIIGILASIVLVSLNSARSKGGDAAVKENLASFRNQAELTYDSVSPGSYATVCATGASMVTAAGTAGGGTAVCNANATNWAVASPLKSQNLIGASTGTDYWCIDSAGVARLITDALPTGSSAGSSAVYACPAS